MLFGNEKIHVIKEGVNSYNEEKLYLAFHDYYKEYQIIGNGGYVYITIAINAKTYNARIIALAIFDTLTSVETKN